MRSLLFLPLVFCSPAVADDTDGFVNIIHCKTLTVSKRGAISAKDYALFLICDDEIFGILTTERFDNSLFTGQMRPIFPQDQADGKFPSSIGATLRIGTYPPADRLACLARAKARDDPAPTIECVSN